jgi:hypothetical protein
MATVASLLRRWPRAAIAVALTGSWVASAGAQRPAEYQIKAAYLYGFGKFVEWPATAPAAAGKDFRICVLGDDPFGRLLDDVAAGAVIKDRPVTLRRIAQVSEAEACHTLFISASEDARLARILSAMQGWPVLTVGDTPEFAERGGMVGFSLEGNRVRFTVNIQASRDAKLTLNSELLRVAAKVLKSREPGP